MKVSFKDIEQVYIFYIRIFFLSYKNYYYILLSKNKKQDVYLKETSLLKNFKIYSSKKNYFKLSSNTKYLEILVILSFEIINQI